MEKFALRRAESREEQVLFVTFLILAVVAMFTGRKVP